MEYGLPWGRVAQSGSVLALVLGVMCAGDQRTEGWSRGNLRCSGGGEQRDWSSRVSTDTQGGPCYQTGSSGECKTCLPCVCVHVCVCVCVRVCLSWCL